MRVQQTEMAPGFAMVQVSAQAYWPGRRTCDRRINALDVEYSPNARDAAVQEVHH